MILIMTILAKDEADILRENIEYHRSQGVDYFIVTDNASTDETPVILKQYEQQGILKYILEKGPYSQSKWVTSMARMAHDEFNADWVINNDADEFWWPLEGNLKSALAKTPLEFQIVRAKRHNLLLNEKYSSGSFYKRMIYRRKTSINPIGKPLPPKVCHRGNANVIVAPGSHSIKGIEQADSFAGTLEIYHYPYRNLEQVCRKVINIGKGYENSSQINKKTGGGPGGAMRSIYQDYLENPKNIERFYARHMLDLDQISAGLETGDIVEDRKLSSYLSRMFD